MSGAPRYVLGSDEAEIARLDGQATAIALPTRLLLQIAGISPGMRVLDLGSGLGHVAFALAELVGSEGLYSASTRTSGCSASRSRAAPPRT